VVELEARNGRNVQLLLDHVLEAHLAWGQRWGAQSVAGGGGGVGRGVYVRKDSVRTCK